MTKDRLLTIEASSSAIGGIKRGHGLRYFFDLTTSAQWTGRAVGVVRVEQELARRARRFLDGEVAFCVYQRSQNRFLTIDNQVASDIIAGRLQIDFAPKTLLAPQPTNQANLPNAVRRQIRRAMLANASIYHAFQVLRGRRFTRAEILRIQNEEFDDALTVSPTEAEVPVQRVEDLSSISCQHAKLDPTSCIISVGLDWQYKDMRNLWSLKLSHGFHYCAIVYDLIPVSFPHFVTPGYDLLLRDYLGELMWVADCTMCISNAVRAEWTEFCASFGVEAIASHSFSLGCDLPAELAEVALPEELKGKRFAAFVSTIEPRKNHRVLYEAWDLCIRTGKINPERDRLVFVGRNGWAVDDLMRELSANLATRESIIVLSNVSDDLLATLYRECAFVLFPSFCEGYGLPLAEALNYGKPSISSNAGSLSEIGGNLVLRIDPKDTIGWAEAIAHYMASPVELDDWSRRIKSAHRPVTWDDSARHFFGTIRNIAW